MLTDEVRITIKGGDGGNGVVHFYTDASQTKGGPDGGNGGDGGSVYFEGVSDITKLGQFSHSKVYQAQNGQPGGRNKRSGKKGNNLIIPVPVGTVANYDNGSSVEIIEVGQKILMAGGGRGGRGNFMFRSAVNQTPQQSEPGIKCQPKKLFLQLKLIAQVGLIGLPNVGKTSLLNELSRAGAKVANYPFTTLEPNLGIGPGGYVIADIPGLIEGAASGKGLGIKFLKHIERTKLLVHCLSVETTDIIKDYQTVRSELSSYSSTLAQKPEIIVLTKSDTTDSSFVNSLQNQVKADLITSIIDTDSLKRLNDLISQKLS